MLNGWKNYLLGDVLTLQRGFDLPERDRQEGCIPIVSSSGISGYHNVAKVHGPGIVTGRYGTLGEVFYINRDFWPLNTTLYVRDFKGNDSLFLSYFLRTLNLAHQNAAGAVPGLNRNALHLLPVCIPPLSSQRKIAAILSAYDDLIENNTRRIAILEEIVQALYREWFVHFRFPGHEKNRMVESELGMIPEGWEVVKLGDVCNITMGQSPSSQFYNTSREGIPFHQGVADFGTRFPIDRVYCTIEGKIAYTRDILFSVRAPVGRMNIANKKIVIGRGLSAIRSKTENQIFVFQQLKERFQEEDTIGNGAIFKAVTRGELSEIKIVQPPRSAISLFEEYLSPMFWDIEVLIKKNTNLRQTRDLLLPKLISGELDVENLDIEVGETLNTEGEGMAGLACRAYSGR
ncbi:MAG: restriction endonuclease subunit S [Ktedonobacteraceae bacterium]|nr:restriction endonuclease subunit S [Ktedonobacteraceae bacterium]